MAARPAGQRRWGSGRGRVDRWLVAGAAAAISIVLHGLVVVPPVPAQGARAPAGAGHGDIPAAVPARPAEPIAAKAYAALDRLCAGCHQAGRLSGPYARPAAAIADILDLPRIAGDGELVHPGVADASPIYDMMLRRHAPAPLQADAVIVREPPSSDELKALRDWIDKLPAEHGLACPGRPFLTPEDTTAAIEQALAATPQAQRSSVRFVSLAPLYNSCASAAELEGHAEGVATVLNILSLAPTPVAPKPVGPGEALLKIELDALGWTEVHWSIIAEAYPYAGLPATTVPPAVVAATRSQHPLLPADWLAATALRPPVYYALTGVPGSIGELERLLQVDAANLDTRGGAIRAAVRPSAVTRADRIVERLAARNGSLWRSYDFANGDGERNLLEHPLGPASAVPAGKPFRHDGAKVMFTGPNGFFKFAVFAADGARLAASPPELERDRAVGGTMAPGLACLSCHRRGPIRPVDALRREASEGRLAEAARAGVLMLHAEQSSMDTLVQEDRTRLEAALQSVGVDPQRMVRGLDPVTALAASYLRGGGVRRAAAEYGRPAEVFVLALEKAPEASQAAARRLRHGVLARRDLSAVLRQLAGAAGDAGDTAAGDGPASAQQPALAIAPSADRYRPGDLVAFTVRTDTSCHLTLISVDTRGIATVLYPNDFEPDSLIFAGKEIRVPSPAAGYQLRARDEGREMVIGLCSPTAPAVAGIVHDFERERFTLLGDWKVFVARSLEALDEPAAARPAQPEPAGRVARRRGREQPRETVAADVPAMTLVDAPQRSVATFEVRAGP